MRRIALLLLAAAGVAAAQSRPLTLTEPVNREKSLAEATREAREKRAPEAGATPTPLPTAAVPPAAAAAGEPARQEAPLPGTPSAEESPWARALVPIALKVAGLLGLGLGVVLLVSFVRRSLRPTRKPEQIPAYSRPAVAARPKPDLPKGWPKGEKDGDATLMSLPDGRTFVFFDAYGQLEVVGESQRQDEIRTVIAAFGNNPAARFRVALLLEPGNRPDAGPVRVVAIEPGVLESTVGYLSREESARWGRLLRKVQSATGRIVLARARVVGGGHGALHRVLVDAKRSAVRPWLSEKTGVPVDPDETGI